jgi:hypothetical protein
LCLPHHDESAQAFRYHYHSVTTRVVEKRWQHHAPQTDPMKCVKDSELSKPACQHISCHGTTVDYGSKTMFVLRFVLKKRVVEED